MKRFFCAAFSLALMCCCCSTAFAEQDSTAGMSDELVHNVVEEVSEILDDISETISDVVVAPEAETDQERDKPVADDLSAAANAEETGTPGEKSSTEEHQKGLASIGMPGAMKTLVVAVFLLGLGAGVIMLANHKTHGGRKGPKKE